MLEAPVDEKIPLKKKRMWIDPARQQRSKEGSFLMMYKELVDNSQKFYDYFRMSERSFNILLNRLKVLLTKKHTHWRKPIPPRERLAMCLRFLTTGEAFNTISLNFRTGHSTVSKIVQETCKIITDNLMPELMPIPSQEIWKQNSEDYYQLCSFPNCLGVLDGKNVIIQAPPKNGSVTTSYKKTYSVVLLTLVDVHNNFIAIDVGDYGENNDNGVYADSKLGQLINSGTFNIPESCQLPNSDIVVPYVFLADEAFPLKTNIMRPYSAVNLDGKKLIFNDRLSIARKSSEETFNILVQKFKLYNKRIQVSPDNLNNIVLATCLLHNFIKKYDTDNYNYLTGDVECPTRIDTMRNLNFQGGNATANAVDVRNKFADFFTSDAGSLPYDE